MAKIPGYVCVFNRNRDGYQVPLALHEAGLLTSLVTDFYAPAGWLGARLPGPLRRRKTEGLPRRRTHSVWTTFLDQALARALKRPLTPVFRRADALLSSAAARIARRTGSALYCYHSYIPDRLPPGAPLVVFVYHPLLAADIAMLEADAARFPEAGPSILREREALAAESGPDGRAAIDWTRVDAVVCASSFTRRSVEADGCDPAKITVIPYGLPVEGIAPAPRSGPPAQAEFLYVGQGIQRKGLHHLIRAWQLAKPASARLTIVSYAIDPEIKALITDPSIRLLGYQSRSELKQLFHASDVLSMPSLVEGFGFTYCEALAFGCHVLGTANSGLPDLGLTDHEMTLVPVGDIEAIGEGLAACARRVLAGEFDRARIHQSSQRWAKADFRRAIADHARAVLQDRR